MLSCCTSISTKCCKFETTCVFPLNFRDEASQVACLKIIHGLLSILSVGDIQTLMPSVTDFSSNKSIVCRDLMFDILIWIYDAYR